MEIQKAPHCNFTGQIRGKQENCSKFAPKILWCSILCSRFRALLTCIPSGCCNKEGLSKVAEGMTEGQIGTEAVKSLFVEKTVSFWIDPIKFDNFISLLEHVTASRSEVYL
jgi:hypothetical protein